MIDPNQLLSRQQALSDFGEFALRSDDLDEVLHEACRIVAEAVGTDFAKVLEIEHQAQTLLVKAGVGWSPGVVGRERLPMHERSAEAYSIELAKPVVVNDIRGETRFEFAAFMQAHGVVALVNVPIFLPGLKAYGLLELDSRKPRDFGEDEIEFLRTYATILGPVIDRLHKGHALVTHQRLLEELQHRVKNHLSIIASMVQLRAGQVRSDALRAELTALRERIETLRVLNDLLHQAGSVDRLRLRPFLTQLVENLCQLHSGQVADLRLDFEIDDVELAPETALPIGLIVNEFVTNSLKYAFDGKGGTIALAVAAQTGRALRLTMRDNGKGLPSGAQAPRPSSGTGMKMIEGLARQIGARAVWSSGEPGTTLCLEFTAKPAHQI